MKNGVEYLVFVLVTMYLLIEIGNAIIFYHLCGKINL